MLVPFKLYDEAKKHLQIVHMERKHYKDLCDKSKEVIKKMKENVQTTVPLETDTIHYSFDYAQQIHYPSDPFQPGPMYFLAPRKCSIFGICCEGIPQQYNYLIDEAVDCGKGGNSVCSMLHHFFATHGLKEKKVHLHADNCCGQNKNNIVLQVS